MYFREFKEKRSEYIKLPRPGIRRRCILVGSYIVKTVFSVQDKLPATSALLKKNNYKLPATTAVSKKKKFKGEDEKI